MKIRVRRPVLTTGRTEARSLPHTPPHPIEMVVWRVWKGSLAPSVSGLPHHPKKPGVEGVEFQAVASSLRILKPVPDDDHFPIHPL